jgi:predicted acyltransferase
LKQRFYSLDIFRGATVALMILVNNPGSWSYIYAPLEHAPWHGCTPTDLVFPFFLFAVGNALAFVMPRLEQAGDAAFLKKIVIRGLLIFSIGHFLNWFPFVKWSQGHLVGRLWTDPVQDGAVPTGIRILGVLQRIAITYVLASLIIYYGKPRGAFVTGAVLLLGYWALCFLAGKHGDPYSLQGYFGTDIDKSVIGVAHMYKGEGVPFDPEGLASNLPAIAQVIFGYLVGNYIIAKGKSFEMMAGLFVTGCLLVFTGFCWDMAFPINKKIWTSSFVVYTTGVAILVLCVLIYAIEMKGHKGGWSKFFDVFGKNALFIFMVSGILPRIYGLIRIADGTDQHGDTINKGLSGWMYDHWFAPAFGNMNGSLAYALFNILLLWALCYLLDKKRIYIKV